MAGGSVDEVPGDIAKLVDAAAECRGGSGDINRAEDPENIHKRMRRAGGVGVLPGDDTQVVDPATPRIRGARNVDRDEVSVVGPQVTVRPCLVDIESHDLVLVALAAGASPAATSKTPAMFLLSTNPSSILLFFFPRQSAAGR